MFGRLFSKSSGGTAEEYFRRASRYCNRKKREFNFGLAIEHFKEAIKLNPENSKYHGELARAYVAAPLWAVTRGIGDEVSLKQCLHFGIEEALEAIRLHQEYMEAYLVLGEAYMYWGDNQKAVEAFQSILELSAGPFFSGSFLTDRFIKSFARRELEHFGRGEGQPDVAREHIERAISCRDEKKYRLAHGELAKALRLAPDRSWLYETICEILR